MSNQERATQIRKEIFQLKLKRIDAISEFEDNGLGRYHPALGKIERNILNQIGSLINELEKMGEPLYPNGLPA